jgi:hypothetical protein
VEAIGRVAPDEIEGEGEEEDEGAHHLRRGGMGDIGYRIWDMGCEMRDGRYEIWDMGGDIGSLI